MAITPIQYPPEAPHIPLGQKISALNAAADQSILTHQAIAEGGLKLKEARQQVADQAGLDAITASGGSDDDMLAKAMGISSSAYMTLREQLAKAHTAEQAQIKAKTDAQKSFFDLMGDRIQTIDSAPEENRPILWKHVVGTLKQSGLPEAAQLPDQYDPNYSAQFSDAKAKLDAFSKTLDNSIKSGKEMRDAAMAATDQADKFAARQKTEAETANLATTPDLKEFNDTGYFQTYLKSHNIDPATLNSTTEAQNRGAAFTEFKRAQLQKPSPTSASMALDAAGGDPKKALELLANAQDEGTSIEPGSLDMLATQFAKTGTLPSLGMGKSASADRRKIYNRANELYPHLDVAANQSDFNTNKNSEKTMQATRDQIVSFENTAGKNLDNFLNTAKDVYDTGSPWINTPIRLVDEKGLGSKDLAAFNAARQVAINEIAKVTSNPGLTGQLSDAARREVESFIPANATLKQIYAVASILKSDMKNRHDSLDEQIKEIQNRISGPVGHNENTNKLPDGAGKSIDKDTARQFYDAAGKDPAKAKQLAIQYGWKVD